MPAQKPFDQYEAAILLDAYLNKEKHNQKWFHAIKKASADLRQMAINRGQIIDSQYRNTNGIAFQIRSMESAYKGKTIIKPATNLFVDIVGMYRNSPEEFRHLLSDAKGMVDNTYTKKNNSGKINNTEKKSCLCGDKAPVNTAQDKRLDDMYPLLYKKVYNVLCTGDGITVSDVYEAINHVGRSAYIEDILDNASWAQFRDGLYYYSNGTTKVEDEEEPDNVDGEIERKIRVVLENHFAKGFRLNSSIENKKFYGYYFEDFGQAISKSEEYVGSIIRRLSIIHDDRAYLPEIMLPQEIASKVRNHIIDNFAQGKKAIYIKSLYNEFEDDFIDSRIHDEDMLKSYLSAVNNDEYYIQSSYISSESYYKPDLYEEIGECLINARKPMTHEEIHSLLPHIPMDKIKAVLRSNVEFVSNRRGEYIHAQVAHFSSEDLSGIIEIIEQNIAEHDFISSAELYKTITEKYPWIIDNNSMFTEIGFRDALKNRLMQQYCFYGNIISQYGHAISMSDVYAEFCKTHESFTLGELELLCSEVGSDVIYYEAVYGNSLRISKEHFVASDRAKFNIKDIDAALELVCPGKYSSLTKINNFSIFPDAGYTWNVFLLESYLNKYSNKFKLLHKGFNSNKCVGAIVKKSSGLDTFDDLLVDYLATNTLELTKDAALKALSDEGYIARRAISNIEELIIRAQAIRNREVNN